MRRASQGAVIDENAISIQVPDELYERAARRAAAQGTSLERALVALVKHLGEVDEEDADENAAERRAELVELFQSVRGFRMLPKILREDHYERDGG